MMKNSRRIITLLLALVMVCSLTATAYAATVNVTSDLTNHSFVAYQILTGTQGNSETALGDVAWGSGINYEAFLTALKADETVGDTFENAIDAKSFAEALANISTNSEAAYVVAAIADANKVKDAGITLTTGTTELADGYYLIVDNTTVEGMDDSKNTSLLEVTRDITISDKSAKPTVDKQVHDEPDNAEAGAVDGWGETADHAMNESFQFKLIATLPADADFAAYETYKVVFNDTMSEGITFENIASVKVNDKAVDTSDYSYTATAGQAGGSWTLTIDDITEYDDDLTDGAVIEVIYNAHLNENAAVGNKDDNQNKVYLEYSNNPNAGGEGELGKTKEDIVWVFTYEMDNTKVNGNEEPLAGAGFKLYSDADCEHEVAVVYDETLGAYRLAKNGETGVEMKSAEGTGVFNIVGLDVGTYYLKETSTPAGYNTCPVITVVITAVHQEDTVNSASTDITMTQDGTKTDANKIVNNAGATLPETGGIGTTIFYTLGGILVLAAVVLLVTKKRMSAAE